MAGDKEYQPPVGYLTLKQLQERLGVSKPTVQRRIRAENITTYKDPRDQRVQLVRLEDVERMLEIVPAKKGA